MPSRGRFRPELDQFAREVGAAVFHADALTPVSASPGLPGDLRHMLEGWFDVNVRLVLAGVKLSTAVLTRWLLSNSGHWHLQLDYLARCLDMFESDDLARLLHYVLLGRPVLVSGPPGAAGDVVRYALRPLLHRYVFYVPHTLFTLQRNTPTT